MKRTIRLMMTMVLLMTAAVTVKAQQTFGGKLTCNGASIKYSVSGVTITEKKKEDTGAHLTWEIRGTVKPGSTVNVSMERTEGKGQSRMAIVSDYRREDDLSMAGIQYEMQPKTSDSKSISISNNSGRYTIVMDFDNKDGNSWSHIKVRLYLEVNGTTTTTTPPKPNEVKAENYKGTFERHGGKMEYSFTNCKVTYKKEDNKFPNNNLHPYYNTTVHGAGIGSYITGNVKPGATMNLACKKVKGNTTLDSVMIQVEVTNGNTTLIKKTYKGKGTLSRSLQVPKNADRVSVCMAYAYLDATFQTRISLDVAEKLPDVPGSKLKWNIVANDDRCEHCKGQWSEYTIDLYPMSEYATMCNSERGWHKHSREDCDVTSIYYNDHIATNGERLTLSKGEVTHNNYRNEELIFRGNTHAWLRKRLDDGTDRWSFYKGFIIGKHLKRSGKPSSSFETDELVVVPKGTIYILQKDDDKTQAYLLQGSMEVTNRKDNKKVTLKPGQYATVTKNGQVKVQQFDAQAMARKYDIDTSEIPATTTTTPTAPATTTTPTRPNNHSTTGTVVTVKRYEVERAIVKYKVTQGSQEGTMAKAFDNYGTLERRELKMGNQTTLQLTQGNTSYNLDRNAKTYKAVTGAELNFLNMNDPVMKKLNLQKKGTATILGKPCTVYTGQNVEYSVWKGIVLKKVQRSGNTTTTTEATSVEQPASVDAKYFKMPDGYTVK